MDILRYYEGKSQNRKTVGYIRELVEDGRIEKLPNALGLHYRRFNPDSSDYSPAYCTLYNEDRYIVNLLTCSNELNGVVSSFGDVRVTGAHHCGNNHLCAVCGSREARRVASQLSYQFFNLKDCNYDYFMLTLTLPNNKDGFRTEFKVINNALSSVLRYCGFNDRQSASTVRSTEKYANVCKGAFAARELTYSDDEGWHPHIHIILAYDKNRISSIKEGRAGDIKCMRLDSCRGRDISTFSIADIFAQTIAERDPDYYNKVIYPYFEKDPHFHLSTRFERISDIDNVCDEICKYFIDYNCFNSADTLFVYMRDIFRISKYTKKGCFGWNKEKEYKWRKWCELGKPIESEICILSNCINLSTYTFMGFRKAYDYDLRQEVLFPAYIPNANCLNNGQPIVLRWNKDHKCYEYDYFSDGYYHTDYYDKNTALFYKNMTSMDYQVVYNLMKESGVLNQISSLDINKLRWKEDMIDVSDG